jgi:hypothetical protein
MLTTVNAAGTNALMCLSKHGEALDNKSLDTHPMTNFCDRRLTSAIAR